MSRTTQTELCFPEPRTRGGRREGAGRPKRKDGVAHVRRARVSKHDPRLVTMKLRHGLPTLRMRKPAGVVIRSIEDGQRRDFRIVHFSVQHDHVHLLLEADSNEALGNGMRGLGRRIASGLNKLWKRTGRVFAERYHDEVLRSLRRVRNALRYVLHNDAKHGGRHPRDDGRPDAFSWGRYFDGWREVGPQNTPGRPGIPVVWGGWKLTVGWRKLGGLLSLTDLPRSA